MAAYSDSDSFSDNDSGLEYTGDASILDSYMSETVDDRPFGGKSHIADDLSAAGSSSSSVIPLSHAQQALPDLPTLESLSVPELQALLSHFVSDKEVIHTSDKLRLLELLTQAKTGDMSSTGVRVATLGDTDRLDFERDQIKIGKIIGSGDFGKVHTGTIGNDPCAIKVVEVRNGTTAYGTPISRIRAELAVLKTIRNKNVIGFRGSSTTPKGNIVIVMELANGDLGGCLSKNPRWRNSGALDRIQILLQIGRGLAWLHTRPSPIIHLDLKFDNILYVEPDSFKLSDFGLSAFLPEGYTYTRVTHVDKLPGNVAHMAPEVMQKLEFNAKADVYSFGILCWEVLKGNEWFKDIKQHLHQSGISTQGHSTPEAFKMLVKKAVSEKNFRPIIPLDWHPKIAEFLRSCWDSDPTARPTMEQIVTSLLPELAVAIRLSDIQKLVGQDELACRFWIANFEPALFMRMRHSFEASHQDAYTISGAIPWDKFWGLFSKSLRIESKYAQYIQLSLDAQSSVTLERFAQFIAAFGPFSDGRALAGRVFNTLCNRWFHPVIKSLDDTSQFLRGQRPGTFMVRYSTQPGFAFTIARVVEHLGAPKLVQTRIKRKTPTSPILILETKHPDLYHLEFSDLTALVQHPKVIQHLDLKSYVVFLSLGERLNTAPLDDGDAYGIVTVTDMFDQLSTSVDSSSGQSPTSSGSSYPSPLVGSTSTGFHRLRDDSDF